MHTTMRTTPSARRMPPQAPGGQAAPRATRNKRMAPELEERLDTLLLTGFQSGDHGVRNANIREALLLLHANNVRHFVTDFRLGRATKMLVDIKLSMPEGRGIGFGWNEDGLRDSEILHRNFMKRG